MQSVSFIISNLSCTIAALGVPAASVQHALSHLFAEICEILFFQIAAMRIV